MTNFNNRLCDTHQYWPANKKMHMFDMTVIYTPGHVVFYVSKAIQYAISVIKYMYIKITMEALSNNKEKQIFITDKSLHLFWLTYNIIIKNLVKVHISQSICEVLQCNDYLLCCLHKTQNLIISLVINFQIAWLDVELAQMQILALTVMQDTAWIALIPAMVSW